MGGVDFLPRKGKQPLCRCPWRLVWKFSAIRGRWKGPRTAGWGPFLKGGRVIGSGRAQVVALHLSGFQGVQDGITRSDVGLARQPVERA